MARRLSGLPSDPCRARHEVSCPPVTPRPARLGAGRGLGRRARARVRREGALQPPGAALRAQASGAPAGWACGPEAAAGRPGCSPRRWPARGGESGLQQAPAPRCRAEGGAAPHNAAGLARYLGWAVAGAVVEPPHHGAGRHLLPQQQLQNSRHPRPPAEQAHNARRGARTRAAAAGGGGRPRLPPSAGHTSCGRG